MLGRGKRRNRPNKVAIFVRRRRLFVGVQIAARRRWCRFDFLDWLGFFDRLGFLTGSGFSTFSTFSTFSGSAAATCVGSSVLPPPLRRAFSSSSSLLFGSISDPGAPDRALLTCRSWQASLPQDQPLIASRRASPRLLLGVLVQRRIFRYFFKLFERVGVASLVERAFLPYRAPRPSSLRYRTARCSA